MHRVLIVAFEGVQSLDVSGPSEVFAGVNTYLAALGDDLTLGYLRRPGGQSQFASPTWIRRASVDPIQLAQESVIDDPAGDHRIA